MSIEVELNGKGGKVCRHSKAGEIQCPLIVRPTSEDVVTGNVFGMLRHVRPHLWLNDMLNTALGTDRFRQVWFKDFSLRLWERQARFPPELLDFREGRTEPDVVIEWENPPTTVWIEAKWLSPMAAGTNQSDDNDQVLRGVRTLLAETGRIRPNRLFELPRRSPVWLALILDGSDALVERYKNRSVLEENLPATQSPPEVPHTTFLGVQTWRQLALILATEHDRFTSVERGVVRGVVAYLQVKIAGAPRSGSGERHPVGTSRQARITYADADSP